eukprot:757557-Hanusia_phi.AAC.3
MDAKERCKDEVAQNPRVPSPNLRSGRASPPRSLSPTSPTLRAAPGSGFSRARSASLPSTSTRKTSSQSSPPRSNGASRDPANRAGTQEFTGKPLRRGSQSSPMEIPWLVLPSSQVTSSSCSSSHCWGGRGTRDEASINKTLTSLKLFTISESVPGVFALPTKSPKFVSQAESKVSRSARQTRSAVTKTQAPVKAISDLGHGLRTHQACKEFQLTYRERRLTGKMYMRGRLDVRSSLSDSEVASVWGKIEDEGTNGSLRRLNLFDDDTYTTPLYSIKLRSVSVVLVPDKNLSFALYISHESCSVWNAIWLTAPSATFRMRWLLALEEAGARIITENFDEESTKENQEKELVDQKVNSSLDKQEGKVQEGTPYSLPGCLRYFYWQNLASYFMQIS